MLPLPSSSSSTSPPRLSHSPPRYPHPSSSLNILIILICPPPLPPFVHVLADVTGLSLAFVGLPPFVLLLTVALLGLAVVGPLLFAIALADLVLAGVALPCLLLLLLGPTHQRPCSYPPGADCARL